MGSQKWKIVRSITEETAPSGGKTTFKTLENVDIPPFFAFIETFFLKGRIFKG
jgi:hypothetical protein